MNSSSINMMKSRSKVRHVQRGAFLLESLIGILIFSLGVLGIVGLQARAIRFTNDAEYRAEAMYLANSLIAQMWTDDRGTLKSKYDSVVGTGAGYAAFVAKVNSSLAGATGGTIPAPVVIVDGALPIPQANSAMSNVVQVVISWQLPGDPLVHNYATTGVIGQQKP
jgi:type IV pilus assembly protein PilV